MEKTLFALAFLGVTAALILYVAYAIARRPVLARLALRIVIAAVVFQSLSLMLRTVHARMLPEHSWYFPWNNWYESLVFFALVILIEYVLVQKYLHVPILGVFVTPLAWGAMLVAVHSPYGMKIPDSPPAFHSVWLSMHVPVMFIAYSALAIAFTIGLAYLIQEWQIKSRHPSDMIYELPSLDDLDRLICRVILWAQPVLTLGLLLGARWAYSVWGRYWGWDAKETWALITWLIYMIYLSLRFVGGWRGRKTVYLSMIGFVIMIFTYVGVNYLSSLHGFLSGSGRS